MNVMTAEKSTPRVKVAIVAPSGHAPDTCLVARAIARFEGWGWEVRNFYDAAEKYQRFGATDVVRAAQLHAAAADPGVDVIVALRGGYGMSRLLPFLDLDALAASGKLFVGHSDFTALQMALLARAGTASFLGPMICDDFSREVPSEFTLRHFMDCLSKPLHCVSFEAIDNPSVDVTGTLWGGNLTMLTHLAGTTYMPRIDDGILFIEDVNEHPYRIERMVLQLFHCGRLQQRAIVFGDFSGYRLNDYDNGYDFDAMLGYLRDRLQIPILRGLPFGHILEKATLVLGSDAHLRADGKTATLTMRGYPNLSARC
jgi:muramoyltetrapeptide carboxypeptidase